MPNGRLKARALAPHWTLLFRPGCGKAAHWSSVAPPTPALTTPTGSEGKLPHWLFALPRRPIGWTRSHRPHLWANSSAAAIRSRGNQGRAADRAGVAKLRGWRRRGAGQLGDRSPGPKMRRAAEGRSAALARAQAQLAGRRRVTQRGQGPAGAPGSVTLSSSSSSHLSASELSNLGGPTAPMGRKEWEGQSKPAVLPQPNSRFLKQQALAPREPGPAGLHPAARRSLSTTAAGSSKGRSSAVLRKLAQIESKLRSRRAGPAVSRGQQAPSDEEPSWSRSSRDNAQHWAAGRLERSPQAEAAPLPPDPAGSAPERTPSPPSRRLGGAAASWRLSSPALLQDCPAAGAASLSPRGGSLSGRSPIRSLEELFSEAGSSSSSEFRVNVLSLEDLAPSMAGQEEETQATRRSSQELGTSGSPFKAPSAVVGETAILKEEEDQGGGTEISERLSGSSADRSLGQPTSPVNTEYSDDFEPSVAEDVEEAPSSAEGSQGSTEASLRSGPSKLPRHGSPLGRPGSTRPGVKEAAVQTSGSWPAAPWGLALVSGSPARLVLSDMLQQNLLLIRHFVEATRHLHASFVASLEEEEFHYHTLEEAKAYIKRHKPRPLTLEQALRERGEQSHTEAP
ncbi:uncharacterized protein C19orf44 homolog isoform X2 [Hemicordylus capensis]|uniref:uncharacterized protein C19orf44 homolog isoform X2 n=1 Tax=Hemicordylus capensis TaxID=884348 RepID=UPI0023048C45|nr:uncharacterized protein C19orf44 homolog isoform X2 [Hemicordylus capensis]